MNHRELHYRYAISYLVIALIAVIGFALFDVPSLVDKTNFALTITSLVLGVVAIIYTFIAGNKQDLQLARLVETNANISQAARDTQLAASALKEQALTIPERLDTLGSKIDQITQAGLPQSETFGDSEAIVSNAQKFKRFLSELPFAGMAALYLANRAHVRSRVIDEALIASICPIPLHFFYGVMKGAEAAGLLSVTYRKGEITITDVSDVLSQNIDAEITHIREIVSGGENHALEKMVRGVDEQIP